MTVVTGSTSVGVTDQLRLLLAEADVRWVVGLPGNPYGALVAAHSLLAPLLSGLVGRPLPALPICCSPPTSGPSLAAPA
ncbi:hypothetical protein OHR86_31440 [Streptomyces sp. NBC_00441]|uniref:hypothetical protein n=1 Tax=Streptomyces sp. NBC_00441 TaxID=2975742 RepID=UPI002E2E3C1A|nr:hypothetical protein [Streptomyces sp. NBC_00441]